MRTRTKLGIAAGVVVVIVAIAVWRIEAVSTRILETHYPMPTKGLAVSPAQGRLLQLLARMAGARRILEIGTLGGYSTIWLARGLPRDGSLVTLEAEPHHADVAKSNIAQAGFGEMVEVKLAPAADSLLSAASNAGPTDGSRSSSRRCPGAITPPRSMSAPRFSNPRGSPSTTRLKP